MCIRDRKRKTPRLGCDGLQDQTTLSRGCVTAVSVHSRHWLSVLIRTVNPAMVPILRPFLAVSLLADETGTLLSMALTKIFVSSPAGRTGPPHSPQLPDLSLI